MQTNALRLITLSEPFSWVICKPFASVFERNFSNNLEYSQKFYFKFILTHLVRFLNSVEWQHLVAAMFIGTA